MELQNYGTDFAHHVNIGEGLLSNQLVYPLLKFDLSIDQGKGVQDKGILVQNRYRIVITLFSSLSFTKKVTISIKSATNLFPQQLRRGALSNFKDGCGIKLHKMITLL